MMKSTNNTRNCYLVVKNDFVWGAGKPKYLPNIYVVIQETLTNYTPNFKSRGICQKYPHKIVVHVNESIVLRAPHDSTQN